MAEQSVYWDRWRELLDTRVQRSLTASEEMEYREYTRIVAGLDTEEMKVTAKALDDLVKEHERVLASIRRLTAAVRAAADS